MTNHMTHDMTARPTLEEVSGYFRQFVDAVRDGSIVDTLTDQGALMADFVVTLTDEQLDHAYEPGKWSLRQVLRHVIDCERVFYYRALCFARGEVTEQPGFDHNGWNQGMAAETSSPEQLADEWRHLRTSVVDLFASLSPEAWDRSGVANGSSLSVRAVAWILAGHADHHVSFIGEHYLTA